jgi:hypothetical protein
MGKFNNLLYLFCCFCKKEESKSDTKLCEDKTVNKKNNKKNNNLFSCFQIQEDEFDIIDIDDEKKNTFEKFINLSQSIATQTESSNIQQKNNIDSDTNIDKNLQKNDIENDFIITDSDLEKN